MKRAYISSKINEVMGLAGKNAEEGLNEYLKNFFKMLVLEGQIDLREILKLKMHGFIIEEIAKIMELKVSEVKRQINFMYEVLEHVFVSLIIDNHVGEKQTTLPGFEKYVNYTYKEIKERVDSILYETLITEDEKIDERFKDTYEHFKYIYSL